MSPRTFARRFRQETGTTPHLWLTQQRVLLARRMLESGTDPIDLVAERCGFQTAAMLRHHFARIVGTSPTAYRRTFLTRTVRTRRWPPCDDGPTMTTWTNWAGTVSTDVTVARPASVAELARIVTTAAAERPPGESRSAPGHSFTAIGATDGVQLRLDRLAGIVARRPPQRARHRPGRHPAARAERGAVGPRAVDDQPRRHRRPDDLGRDLDRHARHRGAVRRHRDAGAWPRARARRRLACARARPTRIPICSPPHEWGSAPSAWSRPSPCSASRPSRWPRPRPRPPSTRCSSDLDANVVGNDHFEFYWFPHTRRVLTKRNNRVLPGTELRPLGRLRHGSTTTSCPTPSSIASTG